MAAAVEQPGTFPESPNEEGDAIYPCKGCGEILEEGKAFELAGNRWHIDCFRCNTCGTLLDSDANLLLLGDGSLICNNCTYSCNACGNKIEDLAILTGDQAFCATCFKCRNCKRKIENLRYARTSQGIFCMSCHESLMARRRKKAKASKQAAAAAAGSTAPIVLDKSLPALPPSAVPQSALDTPDTDGSSDRVPHALQPSRYRSNELLQRENSDNVTLPASTYGGQRKASVSSVDEDADTSGFLPMAFDPSPVPGIPPQSQRRSEKREADQLDKQRDYFNRTGKGSGRNLLREHQSRSRDATPERDAALGAQKPSSPHIASLSRDKSSTKRKEAVSGGSTPISGSAATSPSAHTTAERPRLPQTNTTSFTLGSTDGFKLQDAPKARKNSVKRTKTPELRSGDNDTRANQLTRDANISPGTPDSGINPFEDPKLREHAQSKIPPRGESLNSSVNRKPVGAQRDENSPPNVSGSSPHGRSLSATSITSSFVDAPSYPPRSNSRPLDSPHRNFEVPPRAAGRSVPNKNINTDDFTAPRAPPPPPPGGGHERYRNESITSFDSIDQVQSSPFRSHFKKPSLGGDFNLEDEMQRILSGGTRKESGSELHSSPSVLRRVSNAVRHGRSFSDKGLPTSGHTKSPSTGRLDISSPLNPSHPGSPLANDDLNALRSHLRRAQQRIAELESEKLGLEEKINGAPDIRQVNTELKEKRSTMAFLDTQREMVVRELEVMTDHLAKAKDGNQKWDFDDFKSDVVQEFGQALRKLKENVGAQIEDLVHRRNELTDEIANLIQVKDKGLQEFESLSSKNAQLNELNAQLVGNIQEVYKANRVPNGNAALLSGLGIYTGNKSSDASTADRSGSMTQLGSIDSPSTDMTQIEEAQILNAPKVVDIRKGQQKRFNWKKVGRDVKNTTKGLKGAFNRDDGTPISGPQPVASGSGGLFANSKNNNLRPGQLAQRNNSSNNLSAYPTPNEPSVLFGSELSARCDYEKRVLPALVTRCIEEVELRGMEIEGVYRKSGGSGQVKQIQTGFERDGIAYDISDEDLDIHAVTSCLKQYFRKLPNPLITFDVYDSVLEAAGLQDAEKRGFSLKAAIGNLPERHKDVLEFLIGHLARVVEKESVNLMTPLNLSVVFAPTIMRPISIEREMTDMQAQREVVRALLEHRAVVFD
ncbi:hypothetical protein MBLNU457_g2469t1 [Dothideomycetes sp. NU457]